MANTMQLTLEVVFGPSEGKKATAQSGQTLVVGRLDQAQLKIPNDPWLSATHFSVECTDGAFVLRDLQSNQGTKVEGVKVLETEIFDGDEIRAGDSRFRVRIDGGKKRLGPPTPVGQAPAAPAVKPAVAAAVAAVAATAAATAVTMGALPPGDNVKERVLNFLRGLKDPLYAIMDGARNGHIPFIMLDSGEECQSLYEGEQGQQLGRVAPYLTRVPPRSKLLEVLISLGWGESWGVFLTCHQPLAEVRKHFRHFLMVEMEGGKQGYFRFYDPRVLRTYLPTCTAAETKEFYGPVQAFFMEGRPTDRLLHMVTGKATLIPLAEKLQSIEE